jgi:nicotinamidase-related amidase
MENTALLVIDAQVNMFAEGSSVFEGDKILQTIRRLIAQARAAQVTVIYVQNNGGKGDPDIHGTLGWQIHPVVSPKKGDVIIQKHTPDSFFQTNLQIELDARHIQHLVIAGMQTEFCINATCRRAHELGYEVTLVQDGHSTYDGSKLNAAQIIARYNAELHEKVELKAAKDITFE